MPIGPMIRRMTSLKPRCAGTEKQGNAYVYLNMYTSIEFIPIYGMLGLQ
jgi:hypothetical protein